MNKNKCLHDFKKNIIKMYLILEKLENIKDRESDKTKLAIDFNNSLNEVRTRWNSLIENIRNVKEM